jgi:transcriptional regulator with PAS, ATPase and Fis domain
MQQDSTFTLSGVPSADGGNELAPLSATHPRDPNVTAMIAGTRRTGVDVVGDVPWGTHFCLFYETPMDLLEPLVSYCKAGLESQEFCLWAVAAPLKTEDVRHALTRAIPDFDRYLNEHSIEIVLARDWFVEDGRFDRQRVTRGLNEKVARASARGYAGVRVTGDGTWLDKQDWKDFSAYEHSISQSIANQRLTVLCTYPLAAFGAAEIMDVVRTHQFIVTHRRGTWDVIETTGHKQAKAEIKRLNAALEQRVVERTSQLTAANNELTKEVLERLRAEDKLAKAFGEIKRLKDRLHDENVVLREQIDQVFMFEEIVGSSPALTTVLSNLVKVAPTDSTVLITGETGTGKELIARAIHKGSQRAGQAFMTVNCAAIPSSLIASELFGHEKGAFTGALQRRQGRFELAHSGTLFLDEIGELPPETQIALLRVLQERQFERVGGNRVIQTDVRIITATNRDLAAAIAAGAFRADLFYRLNVFPIHVPPLRDRKEDIPMLVEYLVKRYAEKVRKQIPKIDKNTLQLCRSYSWPGNIRELQNIIERSVILCTGDTFWIDEAWLPGQGVARLESRGRLPETLHAYEKALIEAALTDSDGKVAGPNGAAAKLGIPRSTLDLKIKQLKIKKYSIR